MVPDEELMGNDLVNSAGLAFNRLDNVGEGGNWN